MDKPFFHRLFGRTPVRASEITETTEARASRGDADAQFNLGLKFANGEGAAQDYAQAALWYLKAADQSHSLAQFNLGVMYDRGQGFPRDEAQSLLWIQRAANLGDAGAQHNLGMKHYRLVFNARPQDAPESRIEAYKWLQLAAAQGYKGSEAVCERVTMTMTRDEVTNGNQRLAAFAADRMNPAPAQS